MDSSRFFAFANDPSMPYAAQAILGLTMYFIFRHFSHIYIRRFLKTWSKAWLAFAITMSSTVILMAYPGPLDFSQSVGLPFHFIAQAGWFLHIAFILMGSYQLVFNKPFNRKLNHITVATAIIIALASVAAFSMRPEAEEARHFVRLGSRSLISGVGFLTAGIVVWRNPKFTKGVGQKILSASFLAFSLYQLFALYTLFDLDAEMAIRPGSRGLVNLLLSSTMSMGMIMWLLEDEREKLAKANKDLDSFLYSTSHDLRAPISSILGLTYLGKVELQEEKGREYMGLIEQRVKKLNMIITDILRLSRTKKLGVKFEPINFKEILKETIEDIQFNKGTSSIRLDYTNGSENVFISDHSQMSIILSNLISNAVKYHRLNQDDPFIKISLDQHEHHIVITVEDNGQGIPPQSVNKVFDMFFRASQETEGTGLGLYIVKEAVAKIKGKIDVESVFGKGTKFTVTLDKL